MFALPRPDLFDINVVINDNIPVEDSVMKRLLERKVLKRGPRPDRNGLVKYVVDLPGNSAAWRLGSRFGDGAVTLKTQTPWNE